MENDFTFVTRGRFPHYQCMLDRRQSMYGVYLIDAGGMTLAYEKHEYQLTDTWFWFIHPGIRYYYAPAPGFSHWSHRYVCITGSRVERWVMDGLLPMAPQPAAPIAEPAARMDALITAEFTASPLVKLQTINRLESLLIELALARQAAVQTRHWLDDLLGELHTHYAHELDFSALARTYGLSYRTLRRDFHAAMQMPLKQFVLMLRMQAACELLTTTDLPVKTIAERVGYRDLFGFSRQFRRSTALSPTEYRANPAQVITYDGVAINPPGPSSRR
jgi:AraC family transcriptional regulator of arabinose operon